MEATACVMSDCRSLQYKMPAHAIKKQIVHIMAGRGVKCSEECIVLTAGAQQAISLVTRLLLNIGDGIVTQQFTYPAFLQVLAPFRANILTVPDSAEAGIDVSALEECLHRNPGVKLLYMVTDGHNPLGVSVSDTNRRRIAELLRKYQVSLLEDDAYGLLYYDKHNIPPISAYERVWTFYVGSFSKILAPGLRVGWLVAPPQLISRLCAIKEAADINTMSLGQSVVSECLNRLDISLHIARLVTEYRIRRDKMVEAIRHCFPAKATVSEPRCGFFTWVCLSDQTVDTGNLLSRSLIEEKVSFVPGSSFAVGSKGVGKDCLRLNFSNMSAEKIVEGITRLGSLLKRREH